MPTVYVFPLLLGSPSDYNSETFSNVRNTLPIMSSYGHPVPLVAGQMQEDPLVLQIKNSEPSVISTSFTDQIDTMRIDMTNAYPAAVSLQYLERNFTFSRPPNSYLIIQVTLWLIVVNYG